MNGDRLDFFISHAGSDRAWAEWVAWQLTEAGYTVELDVWDWAAGQNFITKISNALDRCDRVLSLWSAEYFNRSRYTIEEWSEALVKVPGAEAGRLVPLRVEDIPTGKIPGILRTLTYRDLFGLDVDKARQTLLAAVRLPARPGHEPEFPGRGTPGLLTGRGEASPRIPGALPSVWNVQTRNPGFTGRDMMLVRLREALRGGNRAVVQALHGMGGVDKTQLAIEYAHQFAGGYDTIWWIAAEQATLIMDQIAALAVELGRAAPDTQAPQAAQAALAELRGRSGWLLIFDNAEAARDVQPWLPGGTGHVLITTRALGWREIAAKPIEVDVFTRAESTAILRDQVPGLTEPDAGELAKQLGDLPLAIAQAASYLADSSMPAAEYLDLLKTQASCILNKGEVLTYPRSLAAAVELTRNRLVRESPDAVLLAELTSFLAPEPIPLTLFTTAAARLPEALGQTVADPLAWRKLLTALSRSSLAQVDQRSIQMHRLTQVILRDQLTPQQAFTTQALATDILTSNSPGDEEDPTNWPAWAELLPHILARGPATTDHSSLRDLACSANWYLLMRGDIRGGYDLAEHLYEQWTTRLTSDADHTMWAVNALATALRLMGAYVAARELDEGTLARRRRVLGKGHPDTLTSANNLAVDLFGLGDFRAARELDEGTLARRRWVLGEDHPDTLTSANNLAGDLRALGDIRAARELDEDTLARRRRVLGEDHPSTLRSADNLARDLRALGEADDDA